MIGVLTAHVTNALTSNDCCIYYTTG